MKKENGENAVSDDKIKIYIIFAKESLAKMNGIRGKLASQAGHAALHAWWEANYAPNAEPFTTEEVLIAKRKHDQAVEYYNNPRAYKICLVVDTVDELKAIQEEYKDICGTSLVTDAGFTVFGEPTTTCLGIGPLRDSLKTDTLSKLKVLT